MNLIGFEWLVRWHLVRLLLHLVLDISCTHWSKSCYMHHIFKMCVHSWWMKLIWLTCKKGYHLYVTSTIPNIATRLSYLFYLLSLLYIIYLEFCMIFILMNKEINSESRIHQSLHAYTLLKYKWKMINLNWSCLIR